MSKKGKNIYKRKDGRWEGRYIKEYGLSGKIRYGYVYGKTFREAREKQEKAQADLLNHSTSASYSKQNLAVFCEEWLLLNRNRVKKSTYINIETPSKIILSLTWAIVYHNLSTPLCWKHLAMNYWSMAPFKRAGDYRPKQSGIP